MLTVATVNAWEGGKKGELFTQYLQNISQKQKPDFIFLQEAPIQNNESIKALKDYEVASFHDKHNSTQLHYEIMMTLRRKDSPWTLKNSHPILTSKCGTGRVATINTVEHQDSKKKITIANAHLCGGRFDEMMHCKASNIDELIRAKNDMLVDIVKQKVDVVLGDFNSDYLSYLNPDDVSKLQFLMSKQNNCSKQQAQKWHSAPFELLKTNNYTHVDIGDVQTSTYGPQTDNLWYKGNKLKQESFEILDALKSNASDHQGISVKFQIK